MLNNIMTPRPDHTQVGTLSERRLLQFGCFFPYKLHWWKLRVWGKRLCKLQFNQVVMRREIKDQWTLRRAPAWTPRAAFRRRALYVLMSPNLSEGINSSAEWNRAKTLPLNANVQMFTWLLCGWTAETLCRINRWGQQKRQHDRKPQYIFMFFGSKLPDLIEWQTEWIITQLEKWQADPSKCQLAEGWTKAIFQRWTKEEGKQHCVPNSKK